MMMTVVMTEVMMMTVVMMMMMMMIRAAMHDADYELSEQKNHDMTATVTTK